MADLLLIVADAAQPAEEIAAHQETVADVLGEIGSGEVPRLLVMNKVDLLDAPGRARLAAREPDAVFVSARTGEGLDDLREAINAFFERSLVRGAPARALRPGRRDRPAARGGHRHPPGERRRGHADRRASAAARGQSLRGAAHRPAARRPATAMGATAMRPTTALPMRPPTRPRWGRGGPRRQAAAPRRAPARARLRRRRRLRPARRGRPGHRSRRNAPSCRPASPWDCRPAWPRSRCRARAWPPVTASPSSTPPASSTPATAARSRSSCSTPTGTARLPCTPAIASRSCCSSTCSTSPWSRSAELDDTARGARGFGSSGTAPSDAPGRA